MRTWISLRRTQQGWGGGKEYPRVVDSFLIRADAHLSGYRMQYVRRAMSTKELVGGVARDHDHISERIF